MGTPQRSVRSSWLNVLPSSHVTGAAMRLLDSETVSSADASNSNPEIEIHMPADESDAPPISTTAQPSLPEQYEARMQRARAARSMTTPGLRDQLVGTRA